MKNLFYYNIEPYKGYIPNDKIRKNGEPYETGYWEDIIGDDLTKEWEKIREVGNSEKLTLLFKKINKRIASHKVHTQRDNKSTRNVYLNFNFNGIDCFIHRWNYKE